MREVKKRVFIVIFALCLSMLFSSCRYGVNDEKRVDVISDIAEIVNDNYSSDDVETPYYISMTEIDELADKNSDLHKAIERYHDVQQYHVFLVEDDMVLIVVDSLFLSATGLLGDLCFLLDSLLFIKNPPYPLCDALFPIHPTNFLIQSTLDELNRLILCRILLCISVIWVFLAYLRFLAFFLFPLLNPRIYILNVRSIFLG